ncbi:hypothetical protein CLV25_101550 [Acetobacteroides hydrogenigenes]|uniref:Uncharacterized protein n=1 Tax=Acetobacteroides hydrogenigenes TaxID=979970 RepID=A0A4R2F1T7_9BACT|nr:hypothetical protein CLV25_101550 [Acetobacteroides hydrogenigenes]
MKKVKGQNNLQQTSIKALLLHLNENFSNTDLHF